MTVPTDLEKMARVRELLIEAVSLSNEVVSERLVTHLPEAERAEFAAVCSASMGHLHGRTCEAIMWATGIAEIVKK